MTSGQVRHIVILQFKKDDKRDYLALLEQTRPYLDKIPGIISYKIFYNESKYVPENIYGVGVEIIFSSKKALEAFMAHPAHYEANRLFERYLADPPYMVLTHSI